MKMFKLFIVLVLFVVGFSSCSSDEDIQQSIEFKQYTWIGENGYSVIADKQYTNYQITYELAVLQAEPIDSIVIDMIVTLQDATTKQLSSNQFPNGGQMGFYAKNYQYKRYWIVRIETLSDIPSKFDGRLSSFGFCYEDVKSFKYTTKVLIKGKWYQVPEGVNAPNDGTMDSIFI